MIFVAAYTRRYLTPGSGIGSMSRSHVLFISGYVYSEEVSGA